jgi:Kef-type K+ transport system membrane component KefB
MGQPRAVGEIIAGLVLGPSLFGHLFPDISNYVFHSVSSLPITIISQIGLLLLMFQIGMDFDFSHLTEKKNRKAVQMVSIACIALPFALGLMLGQISAPYLAPDIQPLPYSLFVGTALSITAVPVLGRIMMEFNLTRTRVGAIAITAAAVNDVVGWLLLAVISALSVAQFSAQGTLVQLGWLLLYVAICWWSVRPFLGRLIRRFDLDQDRLPPNLMAIVLALIFISGMCTYGIGIFAIFGGFMMGVLVHDQHKFVALWKKTVGDFVLVFFLPVFFTYTGLRTNIAGLDTLPLWSWCLILILAATLGKFGGAYLAARIAGLDNHHANIIGILMNTRGLMELIVLNVGYDLGFIPQSVFTMLVIVAVFTTVITAPVLRSVLPRIGYAVPRGIDA